LVTKAVNNGGRGDFVADTTEVLEVRPIEIEAPIPGGDDVFEVGEGDVLL
jgi:hypothetical protein